MRAGILSSDRHRNVTPPPERSYTEPMSLWRHADFLRLWSAQAVSAFGSRITRTALPIIAVETLGEPERMLGLLGGLQLAPGVLLSLVAGGFVDRGSKRHILIAADLVRAALVLSIAIAWAFGVLGIVHVIAVGAGVGVATALDQITDVAYLPVLISSDQLADGNAKLEVTEAVAEITGPASAGGLIALLGAPLVVVFDGVAYLWSALMIGRIAAREARSADSALMISRTRAQDTRPPDPNAPMLGEPSPIASDLRVGLRAVFSHPQLRPIVLAHMVWALSGGFFVTLYTPFCLRELGLSTATFGVIVAMGGVGSLGGALLSRGLAGRIGLGPTLLVTSMLSLACALFIPLASGSAIRTLGFLAAHQLLGDGFSVAFLIQAVTLRQTVLPQHLLGRANAAIHMATMGLLVIAAVGAGELAEIVGIRTGVWIGVSIGLAAPLLLLPLLRVRTVPAPASALSSADDNHSATRGEV
jgi:hypothetical protein